MTTTPLIELVVPVHDEERVLAGSVERLCAHLRAFPYDVRVTIADNASTDRTREVARRLAERHPQVHAVRLEQKGRGRALKAVWSTSEADVLAYCDVDLSTDLAALLPLVAPLLSGHSDVAIGTRLARGSRVVRGPRREVVSRCYNLLLHVALRTRVSDAQCGFKALRRDAAAVLLPQVRDDAWFFDTELLVLAEAAGMRIHEVPVDWVDDPDSRVELLPTAMADLRGVVRMSRRLGSFAAVGVVSTLAYVVLFWLLAGPLGSQGANLLALAVTAVANTAANRRLTFGVRGAAGRWRHQAQGLVAFVAGLALTSGTLGLLHLLADPSRLVETGVLLVASVAATLLRFGLFSRWIFPTAPHRAQPTHRTAASEVAA